MATSVLNFNVGVLGHIDSGKTTLAKTLSSVAATASFDKNPQSQERGITLDLGFSSFCVPFPNHLKAPNITYKTLQFTLVDCPGHASLIRTIIGGAQIIDLMILVVDVTKGIQTQTAECLVIGEITCSHMLIVLNKIDLLPLDKRQILIDKMKKKLSKTLEKTRFLNVPMVAVSAKPGSNVENTVVEPIGIGDLVETLCSHTYLPHRKSEGSFIFAVDHCFAMKGQGTVMTGTVIQGSVSLLDNVEIPFAQIIRKVKTIQMFKKPVDRAMQGDRVGICLTQFDPKLLERGAVCTPGSMEFVNTVIAVVQRIPYFKGRCCTNSKFHISIMHDTVMAKCSFFGLLRTENDIKHVFNDQNNTFDYKKEFIYLNELETAQTTDQKFKNDSLDLGNSTIQFALLEFEKPVILSKNSVFIGSKLDIDINSNFCRLAFYGNVLELFSSKTHFDTILPKLKVYKIKEKTGIVDRMTNEYEIIGKDLFKKETNISLFFNLKVSLSTGEIGYIEGTFGQSGKVKVRIPNGLLPETVKHLQRKKGKKERCVELENVESIKIILTFKRYVYDSTKKIIQP